MKLWDRLTNEVAGIYYEAQSRINDARIERLQSLLPGVVIRESRLAYDHYGVYVGNGNVIHFTDGKVRETSLQDFLIMPIQKIQVMGFATQAIRKTPLSLSVKRARRQLGKTKYDLLNNNCEHFALWCRTGKAYSSQAFGSTSTSYSAAFGASLTGSFTKRLAAKFGMSVSRTFPLDEWDDDIVEEIP